MKQWFIRTFRKRRAVRIYIATPDKRLREYWEIPKGDLVSIKGIGTYTLSLEEAVLSSRNVPTFVFNTINPEPLDLQKGDKSYYSPDQFQVAIDSKIEREIFIATKTSVLSQDTLIILAGLGIGFAGLGYYLNMKLDFIIENISSLGIG